MYKRYLRISSDQLVLSNLIIQELIIEFLLLLTGGITNCYLITTGFTVWIVGSLKEHSHTAVPPEWIRTLGVREIGIYL